MKKKKTEFTYEYAGITWLYRHNHIANYLYETVIIDQFSTTKIVLPWKATRRDVTASIIGHKVGETVGERNGKAMESVETAKTLRKLMHL